MKKIRTSLILFIFLGLLFPLFFTLYELGVFSSDPKVTITNNVPENAPSLRVVADYDFAPYSFYDVNHQPCGLDVELINEIANKLGMKAEITFTDWQSCKKALQNKEADLILGLEIFSHMNGVLKTVPVSNDTLSIFGKKSINNIAELKGKRVGIMVNSVITRIFDLNCEFVDFYTNTDILTAVDNGLVDYGICHNSVALKIIEKNNLDLVSSVKLMNSYPAIGVREDLPELRNQINELIIQISDSGLINHLDTKWLIDFTHKRTLKEVYEIEARFYIIYGIFFFITLVLLIFMFLHYSHREEAYRQSLEYQASLKKQFDMLNSVAGIYNTMHVINLVEDTVDTLQVSEQVSKYVTSRENATEQMKAVMTYTVIPEDREIVLAYTDLTTLAARMQNKKTLQAEFRGTEIGWFNAQFIGVEYDKKGYAEVVIFTTQVIDEIKKEKEHLLQLSSFDELTKLYNRNSYEEKLKKLFDENVTNATFILLDINELKHTNDKNGHIAGDELISTAAKFVDEVFNKVGNCYRIGGDEFIIIIENTTTDTAALIAQLREKTEKWHGKLANKLALSIGCASTSEIPDFTTDKYSHLIKLADKKMYEDKSIYYKKLGIEPRK